MYTKCIIFVVVVVERELLYGFSGYMHCKKLLCTQHLTFDCILYNIEFVFETVLAAGCLHTSFSLASDCKLNNFFLNFRIMVNVTIQMAFNQHILINYFIIFLWKWSNICWERNRFFFVATKMFTFSPLNMDKIFA